jgi:hypothetical protein
VVAAAAEQRVPEAAVEGELALVEAVEVLHFLAAAEVVHADEEVPEVVEVAVGRVTFEAVQHTGRPHPLTPQLGAAVWKEQMEA